MQMAKYVTDEIKKLIGKETEPRTFDVERGHIRRFAEAIGDSNPIFNDEAKARDTRFGGMVAPPTFGRAFGIEFFSIPLKMPTARGLDGGSDWEYFVPIRPGDRISVVSKLADVRESEGRLGTMIFTTVETRYVNQFGQVCVIQRSTGIRY
jgi:acyl dehydratase